MKIGIDIGSTATKVAVINNDSIKTYIQPTSWSGVDTANSVKDLLKKENIDVLDSKVVATGYGRVSVSYANKTVTEITCHAKGVSHLFGSSGTIIDIGGQDTKVISIEDNMVKDFNMNDKCSAGTGKFLEIMANRLGMDLTELFHLASLGDNLKISSMCTVFAESEIISLIGRGCKKEDIAHAIVESVLDKVLSLVLKHNPEPPYFLTGGLCEQKYLLKRLSERLGHEVSSSPMGRFAGAIGAALMNK